jgi:uncharacterized membrane protein YraQ (UPF0718 family)
MLAFVLYGIAGTALVASACADGRRTAASLHRAASAFEGVLPVLLTITLLAGAALALLSPDDVSRLIGRHSGWRGMAAAAAIGSATLLPGFVAFPLAAALLKSGAGFAQVILFVSTSTMVNVLTLPLEAKTFGRKVAIVRNALSLALSGLSAAVLSAVLG